MMMTAAKMSADERASGHPGEHSPRNESRGDHQDTARGDFRGTCQGLGSSWFGQGNEGSHKLKQQMDKVHLLFVVRRSTVQSPVSWIM